MHRELTYNKWVKYIHDYQLNKQTNMKKIYVNNSRFIELVDEIATQITETEFKKNTWEGLAGLHFTDEAQDYYNGTYDEIEKLINDTINVFNSNDKE